MWQMPMANTSCAACTTLACFYAQRLPFKTTQAVRFAFHFCCFQRRLPDKAQGRVSPHQQPCPLDKADRAESSQAQSTATCLCSCNSDCSRSCFSICQVDGGSGAQAVIDYGCQGHYGIHCTRGSQLLWQLWLVGFCMNQPNFVIPALSRYRAITCQMDGVSGAQAITNARGQGQCGVCRTRGSQRFGSCRFVGFCMRSISYGLGFKQG